MAADGQYRGNISFNTTPGLQSLFDLGNGEDVGADLSGDGGEV